MKCVKFRTLDFKIVHSKCIFTVEKQAYKGGVT